MKNIFIAMLLIALILPFGGIGFSGITNIYNMSPVTETTNHTEEIFYTLISEYDGTENGLNLFIYFDAIPNGWAVEYSKELRVQLINMTYEDSQNNFKKGPMPSYRTSDYLTLRKELFGLTIPFLAKASLYLGGGVNQHNSTVPSISLLKDIIDANDSEDLFNNIIFDEVGLGDVMDELDNYSLKAQGLHIQLGLQGKILTYNAFINAKYTFIIEGEGVNSFPGLTIGLAYGI